MPRSGSPDDDITLDEAASRLGVHYMTAYRYVRTGRLAATKREGQWRVPVAAVEGFESGDGQAPPGRRGRPRIEAHRARLVDRLLANDEPGAWTVVEGAQLAGLDATAVHLDLLAPALRTIGERWARGEVSVADEHRATAVATRLVGRLGPQFVRRGRRRGTVVVGGAPGDHHALPVAMLADVLRGSQYAVVDLGAATPVESFVDAVRSADDAVAVCVSLSDADLEDAAADVVRAVHEAADVPVLVGGPGCAGPEHAARLGADGTATDAAATVELVERLR